MGYSHGFKWDDEKIIHEVKKMMSQRNMETFPTHSEMLNHFGNRSLLSAISKRGGTQKFANMMGIETKKCESKFGEKIEEVCSHQIEKNTSLKTKLTNSKYPYDILVQNAVKVDVKASVPFDNYGGTKYHTFNLEKKMQTCDVFVFYCMSKEFDIERTLIIPSFVLSGMSQLAVGSKSKYNKYIDSWQIIRKYFEFISSLV